MQGEREGEGNSFSRSGQKLTSAPSTVVYLSTALALESS